MKKILIGSAALVLSAQANNDHCAELMKTADIIVNKFNLDLGLSSYDKILDNFNHIQSVSKAVKSVCSNIPYEAPEIQNKYPCSSIKNFMGEILSDYSYDQNGELEGHENIAYTIGQLVNLADNTKEGNCLIEWKTLSPADGEPKKDDAAGDDKATLNWWLDPNSYNNTHIEEILSNTFKSINYAHSTNSLRPEGKAAAKDEIEVDNDGNSNAQDADIKPAGPTKMRVQSDAKDDSADDTLGANDDKPQEDLEAEKPKQDDAAETPEDSKKDADANDGDKPADSEFLKEEPKGDSPSA